MTSTMAYNLCVETNPFHLKSKTIVKTLIYTHECDSTGRCIPRHRHKYRPSEDKRSHIGRAGRTTRGHLTTLLLKSSDRCW